MIFLLVFTKGYSQQFYVSDASGQLQRITITGGSPVSKLVGGCGAGSFFSIAIYGSKIYYNTIGGALYEGDLTKGENPAVNNCTLISNGVLGTSLTIDKDGIIYFVNGNELSKIDPATGQITDLGTMPYSSAGDLVFYKNSLYMAALDGIIKVSVEHPEQSTMYIPISDEVIYGLTTVVVNDQVKVYALTASPSGTELLDLDMENKVVKGSVGSLLYIAYDAGSSSETGIIPIEILSVDITRDCNGAVNGDSKGRVQVVNTLHTSSYTFTLNTGEQNHGGIFDNLDPGDYSITITSDGGEAPVTVKFTIPDYNLNKPLITSTVININCTLPGSVKFAVSVNPGAIGSIKYGTNSYNIGDAIPVSIPGINHFTVYDTNGCIIDELDVNVPQDACGDIAFPNAFTPNGDGINDFFKPIHDSAPQDYKLLIFNRYGQQLFQSTTVSNGWDGNYGGKPVPFGVYYWIATFTNNNAGQTLKGYVTVIR